ncbi:MAG: hypothetical protein K1W16_14120 [Lachnospiraceae bacterium]|jgi:Threonyl-tRNA synthetase
MGNLYDLKKAGLRCRIDKRSEKRGYKIRVAQMERIPYMLIVGKKRRNTNYIFVPAGESGDLSVLSVKQLLEVLRIEGIMGKF